MERLKDIVRVYFLDPSHGYAIGFPKAVYETTDGGKKWIKLAAASQPTSDPKHTVYDCIAFRGQHGIILGVVERDQFGAGAAVAVRAAPAESTTVILETLDGGKTWQSSTKTNLGEITQVNLSKEGTIVLLVEYRDNYTLPSSVVEWPPGAEQLTRFSPSATEPLPMSLCCQMEARFWLPSNRPATPTRFPSRES